MKFLKIAFATTLFWSINYLIVFLCWSTSPVIALFVKNKNSLYQMWGKIWGKALMTIAATQLSVEGLENIPKDTPLIYAPNHQSNLDWMILWAILPLPFHYVIKKELFEIPLFSAILRGGVHFSLDRENGTNAFSILFKAIKIARKESIVIFPEGTRTRDGSMGKFKEGAFLLAFKSGTPIIPVAISGSFEIMPRYSRTVNRGEVKVKIGSPLSLNEFREGKKEHYEEAANKVRQAVSAMLSELERKNV